MSRGKRIRCSKASADAYDGRNAKACFSLFHYAMELHAQQNALHTKQMLLFALLFFDKYALTLRSYYVIEAIYTF